MKKYLLDKLRQMYKDAIRDSIVIDKHIEEYVDKVTQSIVDTTLKFDELNNMQTTKVQKPKSMPYDRYFGEMVLSDADKKSRIALAGKLETVMKDFFLLVPLFVAVEENVYELSDDRAMLIAENESNALYNYDDLQQAILMGYTKKTWNTILDRHTRNTHRNEDGTTIPIDKAFTVGNSEMMYPKDLSLGASAEETVNCRCSITYSR